MIYTERSNLTVLEMPEERDFITLEELIPVLSERPSNTIYVEVRGLLYGIVTRGRIERCCRERCSAIKINTHFSSISPEEHYLAREVFHELGSIHAMPVVDSTGKLLGDYTKTEDFISPAYLALILNKPELIQEAKTLDSIALIRPKAALYMKRFSNWQAALKSRGILLKVIEYEDITEYKGPASYLLCASEEEMLGLFTLHHIILKEPTGGTRFVTCSKFFYWLFCGHAAQILLNSINQQGASVLTASFSETNNYYLASLNDQINCRFQQRGEKKANCRFPAWTKKEFFGEKYSEELAAFDFAVSSIHMGKNGFPVFRDVDTHFVHIQDNERQTTDQPETYERCIYLYGVCLAYGLYAEDNDTIASFLQRMVNSAGLPYRVVNRGMPCLVQAGYDYTPMIRLMNTELRRGDIVIFLAMNEDDILLPSLMPGVMNINLADTMEQKHVPASWFVDAIWHCNYKVYQIFAEAIYNAIRPSLHTLIENRNPIQIPRDWIDTVYFKNYFSTYHKEDYAAVGAIVMNCNPFTFGHRYLIETAYRQVDFLIIFVVEENQSLFSFQERFAMVCDGTADLKNVKVIPSGEFILSASTFPEYFRKETSEELVEHVENDITLFAEQIAPRLGITHRFIGEELEDQVTNEYNQAMKRILPSHGIQVVEIPRMQNGSEVISASKVRKCLKENDLEMLDKLVPDSTKEILFFENS